MTADKKIAKIKRPSALKRHMQSEARRVAHRSSRAVARTAVRSLESSIASGDSSRVRAALSAVYSIMDKGVKTGLFKKNYVSRMKSRLAGKVAHRSASL